MRRIPRKGGRTLSRTHVIALASLCLLQACVSDRQFKADQVDSRIETKLKASDGQAQAQQMGALRQPQAVRLALRNNPQFRAAMVDLQISEAELIQARVLPNPLFSTFFPVGPKQFEFTLFIPLDAVLLRPNRVKTAEFDCEQVSQTLVKSGLDLVREVKIAYARLHLARRTVKLFEQEASVLRKIARFNKRRFELGDISESEASQSMIQALDATRLIAQNQRQVQLAEAAVTGLLGLSQEPSPPTLVTEERAGLTEIPNERVLLRAADLGRPDLKAMELALKAAGLRRSLAKWDWLRYLGVLDVNKPNGERAEVGPGLQVELPVFDRGQGNKARSQARLEKLLKAHAALKHQITVEVRRARLQLVQVQSNYQYWVKKTLPEIQRALELARREYQAGHITDLPVLESQRQVIQAHVTKQQFLMQLKQARAELEWSIGGQLKNEAKER